MRRSNGRADCTRFHSRIAPSRSPSRWRATPSLKRASFGVSLRQQGLGQLLPDVPKPGTDLERGAVMLNRLPGTIREQVEAAQLRVRVGDLVSDM